MALTRVTGLQVGDGSIKNIDIADSTITDVKIASANKDGAAGTPSMRTLGTGALQSAAGNHTHAGVYQPIMTNPVTGTGTTNFLTKWSGTNTVNASGAWRETSNRLSNAEDNGSSEFQVTGRIDLKSKNTQGDGGQLGAELLTTGTGDASWTGTSFATGYTHSTGSVTTLTSALAPVINNLYQVAYTVTGLTAGSFNIAFGGATTAGITSSSAVGHRASTTGTLVITPTSDFNGTIVLSIKQITAGTASFVFRDNGGTIRSELRILGSSNTASGISALQNNTTGSNNTASGIYALQNNTTGFSNTANGVSTLQNNTTGGNNTASGANAGRFISNGATSLTVANNSTFLGANTKALADNSTNETVVGDNAIGDGNNTVSIGSASVVSSRLRGRLLQGVVVDNLVDSGQFSGNVLATGFKTASGTASQFLKANGSVDSNTYLTSAILPTVDQTIIDGSTNAVSGKAVFDGLASKANNTLAGIVAALGYTPENLANKQNSLAVDGSNIKYPTVTAVNAGLDLKSNDNAVVHLEGTETITGLKTFSANLIVQADITALTNFKSSSSNIILSDNAGTVFRGTRANAWSDNLNTRFFQVGSVGDNIVFTTQSAVKANRFMFHANKTQVSSGNYTTTIAPLGIFEVTNGTSRFFNVFESGNSVFGGGTDDSTNKIQVAGTVSSGTTTAGNTPPTANNQLTRKDYVDKGLATKVTSTGTTNYIQKSTGTGSQGNSSIIDNGSSLSTSLPIYANSFIKSGGSTNILLADGTDITQLSLPVSTATQTALNGKEPIIPTGTALQYIKGDKTLGTFPTVPTVDQSIIDGSTNAVSGKAVFDALALKLNSANPTTSGVVTLGSDPLAPVGGYSVLARNTATGIVSMLPSNTYRFLSDDVDWTEISNKPSTIAPSPHTHVISDVTGLQGELDARIIDTQIEVSSSTNVLVAWNQKTILFTANCTITVPATLLPQYGFVFRTLAGVTVTWAITAPFTWETTPTTTPAKTTGSFMRRGNTNTILLDF